MKHPDVTPLMPRTSANPDGLPMDAFDKIVVGTSRLCHRKSGFLITDLVMPNMNGRDLQDPGRRRPS